MRFIKEDNSLWAHDNRSGTIADSFYKQWVDDGKEVDPYVVPTPTAQEQIAELEASITARNMRGAVSGDAYALKVIADVDAAIAALRPEL